MVMAENEEEALHIGREITQKIEDDLYWEFCVRRFPGRGGCRMRDEDWKEKLGVIGEIHCTVDDFRKTMEDFFKVLRENNVYPSFHDIKELYLELINNNIDKQDYEKAQIMIEALMYVYCHEISVRYPFLVLAANHPKHLYGAIYFDIPINGSSIFPLNTIYKAIYCADDDVLEQMLQIIEVLNRNG
jgi:hypothetical protein